MFSLLQIPIPKKSPQAFDPTQWIEVFAAGSLFPLTMRVQGPAIGAA
jgi:hypothetical protein